MCVGNGDVVEAVNDVINIYSAATGASLLPDNTAANIVAGFPRNVNHAVDLNSFYGYPPAINGSTGYGALQRATMATDFPAAIGQSRFGKWDVEAFTGGHAALWLRRK